jgi:Carbohydrate binding domain (family 11)
MKLIIPLLLCFLVFLTPSIGRAGEIVIADFDANPGNWTTKGKGVKLETTGELSEVKEGKTAGKLIVDYDQPYSSNVKFELPDTANISRESGTLSFWLLGDGSGAKLQFSFVAQDDGIFSVEKTIDWTGWTEVVIPLRSIMFNKFAGASEGASQTIDPSKFMAFVINTYAGLKAGEAKHTYCIDGIHFKP